MLSLDTNTETYTKTESRLLPCQLTDDERAAMGREAARAVKEFTEVEEEKKAAVKEFTSDLKRKRVEINSLSEMVDTGIEFRSVDVKIIVDPFAKKATVIRTDTGEVIQVRPLTVKELQTEMEME